MAKTAGGDPWQPIAGLKFGFADKGATALLRRVEKLGETKVLACPRLLVVDKQRAEIELGDEPVHATAVQTPVHTAGPADLREISMHLRLRPFVSAARDIRLEIHSLLSLRTANSNSAPQTFETGLTANVMVPDGATLVIGGWIITVVEPNRSAALLRGTNGIETSKTAATDRVTRKEIIVLLTPHIWRR
jgi:general secretion pathway protein D